MFLKSDQELENDCGFGEETGDEILRCLVLADCCHLEHTFFNGSNVR